MRLRFPRDRYSQSLVHSGLGPFYLCRAATGAAAAGFTTAGAAGSRHQVGANIRHVAVHRQLQNVCRSAQRRDAADDRRRRRDSRSDLKLADPGPQLKSLVKFLRDNAEPLAGSRMMIATWPVRSDIPSTMAALEFASADEAAKFAPKLETFLPTVLPPVPVDEPTPESSPQADAKTEAALSRNRPRLKLNPRRRRWRNQPLHRNRAKCARRLCSRKRARWFSSATELSRSKSCIRGTLRCFPKIRTSASRAIGSRPSRCFFFSMSLWKTRTRRSPPRRRSVSDEEREVIEQKEAEAQRLAEEANATEQKTAEGVAVDVTAEGPKVTAVLTAGPSPSPTPTPTKEQQAQTVASNQIGNMLSMLGQGQPQWPEAIGVALALDNDELRGARDSD